MKTDPQTIGKKIIADLKKNGVLLLQDKTFPSIVATIVGKPIEGSWWSHPLANPIYNGLNWAIDHGSILSAKLLSKKVTYIDKELYPFFFSIVNEVRPWQIKGISDESSSLLKLVFKSKAGLRSDDAKLKLKYPLLKKHIDDLESRLLIYTSEVHTNGGKHAKEIRSWEKSNIFSGQLVVYEEALKKFNNLVSQLNKKTDSRVKLPW